MSSSSLPISSQRFAAALESLPLSSLHAKISELQNSISHLESSNAELKTWAEEGDKECYEAMMENRDVIRRMEERVELVRREIVEVRGLPLGPEKKDEVGSNGMGATVNNRTNTTDREHEGRENGGGGGGDAPTRSVEDLSDEEVERLLRQMREGPVGQGQNTESRAQNRGSGPQLPQEQQEEEEGVFL